MSLGDTYARRHLPDECRLSLKTRAVSRAATYNSERCAQNRHTDDPIASGEPTATRIGEAGAIGRDYGWPFVSPRRFC